MAASVPDLQKAIEMVNGTTRHQIDGQPVKALPKLIIRNKILKMDDQDSHHNKIL